MKSNCDKKKGEKRNWSGKYLIEWILAASGIIITCPLMIAISLIAKIASRGPVFYTAKRIGRNGKIYFVYKFRSMRIDAPMILGQDKKVLTLRNDPRLTALGPFLRLGFDELPQLLNVVKRDMCLIGPRPDVPWELTNYNKRQATRLKVLPGITGLAAVTGGRFRSNAWNYEMDARYVENSSWRTDIKIMILTIPYALGREGIAARWMGDYLEGMKSE